MQVALLDRIAGTQAAAAEFGGRLRRLRELDAQLAAIDALGDEHERDALQALVDEVNSASFVWLDHLNYWKLGVYLAAIDTLGDAHVRDALQALVDEITIFAIFE